MVFSLACNACFLLWSALFFGIVSCLLIIGKDNILVSCPITVCNDIIVRCPHRRGNIINIRILSLILHVLVEKNMLKKW